MRKLSLGLLIILAFAALTLPGCSTLREAGCIARDNTSNPCNW